MSKYEYGVGPKGTRRLRVKSTCGALMCFACAKSAPTCKGCSSSLCEEHEDALVQCSQCGHSTCKNCSIDAEWRDCARCQLLCCEKCATRMLPCCCEHHEHLCDGCSLEVECDNSDCNDDSPNHIHSDWSDSDEWLDPDLGADIFPGYDI